MGILTSQGLDGIRNRAAGDSAVMSVVDGGGTEHTIGGATSAAVTDHGVAIQGTIGGLAAGTVLTQVKFGTRAGGAVVIDGVKPVNITFANGNEGLMYRVLVKFREAVE